MSKNIGTVIAATAAALAFAIAGAHAEPEPPSPAPASSPASAPAWTARCAARLTIAQAMLVKHYPRFRAGAVKTEATRATFTYEKDSVQFVAEASFFHSPDRAWYDPGCGEGCADLIAQRFFHDRLGAYYVFAGVAAQNEEFARIFKPAIDDCLSY